MNADTYKITTNSLPETLQLGGKLGRSLKGGHIVELVSDLGGGKTVMVKGIALGLGYKAEVTSPTFTISRVYKLPKGLELHHFDFYRLDSADIVVQELSEVLGDPSVIVAIEWAANAGDVLPIDRLQITIERQDEETRLIIIKALGKNHLPIIQGLKQ